MKAARPVLSLEIRDTGFVQKVINMVPGTKMQVIVHNVGKSPHGLRIRIGKREFGPTEAIRPDQRIELYFYRAKREWRNGRVSFPGGR